MIVPSVVVITLFRHMIALLYCRGEGGGYIIFSKKEVLLKLQDLTLAIESRVPKTKPPFPKFEEMTHKIFKKILNIQGLFVLLLYSKHLSTVINQ